MEITVEMVERLREKAPVSYAQAKEALEYSEGNLLDALIYLEEKGAIPQAEGTRWWRRDEPVTSLPLLILLILFVFAFYVTIPLLLIGLFFGFRYRFSGPELERDSINDVMENVASTAADMGRQVMDELHLQYEKRTRDRDGKE